MSVDIKEKFLTLLVAIPLFLAGCGNHDSESIKSRSKDPVAVVSVLAVRSAVEVGGGEVLLVPASAIFRKGELTAVFVVGVDNRLTVRWISTGRSMQGDLVVLGGLDKGEFVVGVYSPSLVEGVTVIKSVTAEDQTHE